MQQVLNSHIVTLTMALASNIAVVIVAMLVYLALLEGKIERYSLRWKLVVGCSFGIFAILSMLVPIHVRDGVIIDAKYPIVTMVAVYGGPLAGLLTAIIAGSFRAGIGGMGVSAAIPILGAVWVLGSLVRPLFLVNLSRLALLLRLLFLGFILWFFQFLGGFVFLLYEPWSEVRPLLIDRSLPALLVFPFMTVFMGMSLKVIESRYLLRKETLASEARFQGVFEKAPVGLAIFDANFLKPISVNPGYQRMFGNTSWPALDELIHTLLKPVHSVPLVPMLASHLTMPDGSIKMVEFSVSPLALDAGPLLLVTAMDRTSEYQANEARDHLLNDLDDRNRELEMLNRSLHHNLRTPLVTIQGFLGELRFALQDGRVEDAKLDLNRVQGATVQLKDLLLGISRLNEAGSSTENESSDVSEVIAQAVRTCQRAQIKASDILYPSESCRVKMDGIRLRQLVDILLSNCLSYAMEERPLQVRIGFRRELSFVIIWFEDNGIGMDSRYFQKIFEPFERLDSLRPRAGLGLTVAKRIVENHQGRIWVESPGPGCGCTFFFTLPSA